MSTDTPQERRSVRTIANLALVGLLVGLLTAPVAVAKGGSTAPLPDLQPGDRWEYRKVSGPGSGGIVRDVLRSEGELLVESIVIEEEADHPTHGRVTSRTEQVVHRQRADHALVTLGSHATATLAGENETVAEHSMRVRYEPPLRQFRHPFRAGDEWTVRSTEHSEREGEAKTVRELTYRVEVVREERVQTVAGFFDALVVEARDESEGSAEGSMERFWWAPQACGYARREVERSGELVAVHELVEAQCKDPNLDATVEPDVDANGSGAIGFVAAAAALVGALGWKRRSERP